MCNTQYLLVLIKIKLYLFMKISIKDLLALQFQQVHVTAEESGSTAFDYYVFETPFISLISNEEIKNDDEIRIYVFNNSDYYINKLEDLEAFILSLKAFKK